MVMMESSTVVPYGNDGEFQSEPSCRFHNVCYDHVLGQMIYYLNPKAQGGVFTNVLGGKHNSFPEQYVPSDSMPLWYRKQSPLHQESFLPKVGHGIFHDPPLP